MGYGNVQGTFNIGIVETDVQAIVNGITGYYGRTLTDVDNDIGGLGSYLYDGNSAVNYLNWIANNTGSLQGYLAGYNYGALYDGNTAVQYLNWINSNTGSLSSYLWDGNSAATYLNWISGNTSGLQSYLGGWSSGPLTDTASNTNWTANNTSSIAYYLYNGSSAVDYLGWINSNIQNYLYDYNTYQSAASLLADIRNLLQQFSFDGSGRLRVNTTG